MVSTALKTMDESTTTTKYRGTHADNQVTLLLPSLCSVQAVWRSALTRILKSRLEKTGEDSTLWG